MKILLTGGSGFLGKNIGESFLAAKHNIIAPGRGDLDLADDSSVEKFFYKNSFDAVIHAAGKAGHRNAPDRTNIFYTDMRMFMNLLQYRNNLGKVIILSSGAIYDQQYSIVKVQEAEYRSHVPIDEHAFYRRVSAELIEQLDNAVELRIFGIFGKYEDYTIRFISNTICKTIFNLPITIKQNRRFNYIFVDDLMPILDYFLESNAAHKAYNIVPDEAIELKELAKKINSISGKNLPILCEQPGLAPEYSGNNSRLKAEIQNLQLSSLDSSIQKLYDWYLKEKISINPQALNIDGPSAQGGKSNI